MAGLGARQREPREGVWQGTSKNVNRAYGEPRDLFEGCKVLCEEAWASTSENAKGSNWDGYRYQDTADISRVR
jgi:hypothetical protein